jgi:hypothetical protein
LGEATEPLSLWLKGLRERPRASGFLGYLLCDDRVRGYVNSFDLAPYDVAGAEIGEWSSEMGYAGGRSCKDDVTRFKRDGLRDVADEVWHGEVEVVENRVLANLVIDRRPDLPLR